MRRNERRRLGVIQNEDTKIMDGSTGGLSTQELRVLEELSRLKRLHKMVEKKKVEKGDVVRLKSGGPKMVITGGTFGNLKCAWFEGSILHEGQFHNDALELVP